MVWCQDDETERTLVQLHFLRWRDKGVPGDLYSLRAFRRKVHVYSSLQVTATSLTATGSHMPYRTTQCTCHPAELHSRPYPSSWWRGTVVERLSLAGELSLSCARPAADG